jgi:hypothetical protein
MQMFTDVYLLEDSRRVLILSILGILPRGETAIRRLRPHPHHHSLGVRRALRHLFTGLTIGLSDNPEA